MLGIILGGAIGYIAAANVRKPEWSNRRTRGPSERRGVSRYFGQQSRSHTSGSVEKDESTDLIASNKVEGTAVFNRQGEKLGEVYNFMVGKRSGQVAYAIMSFGGVLGIGQKYHPLPWNALTYDTSKKGYVIDADKERLLRAPNYAAGEEPFSWPEYGRQVRDYWSSGLT
ncbi:photosystem reaction center subunit H [Microvirga sp. KLBC 81]|nr:photosystem reaction center subunit H [Microvirga sp. KLBC 81]